jgi:hypothetical protein
MSQKLDAATRAAKNLDKISYIQKRVNTIQDSFKNNPKGFWKSIRRSLENDAKHLSSVYITDEDGATTPSVNPQDIEDAIIKMYEPFCKSRGDRTKHEMQELLDTLPDPAGAIDNVALDLPITIEEATNALRHLPLNKAPGPDDICAEYLRKLVEIDGFAQLFTDLCNKAQRHGVPDGWRRSITVLLHKGGDVNLVDKYRPIALTTRHTPPYST